MAATRGAALALVVAALAGCAHSQRAVVDAPTIAPWTSIGSAKLGADRAEIERVYHAPTKVEHLRRFFPAGSKYFGRVRVDVTYRVRGGKLRVTYVDDKAKALETTSPRYRLPNGIHVGVRVITHRHKGCDECWRGYGFDDCTALMIKLREPLDAYLSFGPAGADYRILRTRGYRIRSIGFGDPSVLLLCF
jgi:hypothetical protein